MRCPKCGADTNRDGECSSCGHAPATRPRGPDWHSSKVWPESNKNRPVLIKCPKCGEQSLYLNSKDWIYECLNKRACPNTSFGYEEISRPKKEAFRSHIDEVLTDILTNYEEQPRFSNPLMLTVKMFLAEILSWRRRYVEGEYVCSDFADEVFKAATAKGIRCGYVTIEFQLSYTGHALVAFETDYGLAYFEPQSGEQVNVRIGNPYPIALEGVPPNDAV